MISFLTSHVRSFTFWVQGEWDIEKCIEEEEMERITGGWRQKMQRDCGCAAESMVSHLGRNLLLIFSPLCKSM